MGTAESDRCELDFPEERQAKNASDPAIIEKGVVMQTAKMEQETAR